MVILGTRIAVMSPVGPVHERIYWGFLEGIPATDRHRLEISRREGTITPSITATPLVHLPLSVWPLDTTPVVVR